MTAMKRYCVSISGNLNKSAKQPMKIAVANACRIQCKQGSNVAHLFVCLNQYAYSCMKENTCIHNRPMF